MRDAIGKIKTAAQVLNLDEVGLCSRPDKGRVRRVAFLQTVNRQPTFREEQDGSHVTLTACVSLGGDSLKPHFCGMTECPLNTPDLALVSQRFAYEKTAKGRQTTATFTNYCRTILKPYVESVRQQLNDPRAVVYLILDNAPVHNIPDVLREIGIHPIWLPAHSSHFLQVLDLLLFAELKKAYTSLRTPVTSPKVEGKVIRILRAWHKARDPLTIIHAWNRACIVLEPRAAGAGYRIQIPEEEVLRVIRTNCPDAQPPIP